MSKLGVKTGCGVGVDQSRQAGPVEIGNGRYYGSKSRKVVGCGSASLDIAEQGCGWYTGIQLQKESLYDY